MPSMLKSFKFSTPKTVPSGHSIQLSISVDVTKPPKELLLIAEPGYQCDPPSKTYATEGHHEELIWVIITGNQGQCVIKGKLGASELEDLVEVT